MAHDERRIQDGMPVPRFPVDRYEIMHRISHQDVDGDNRLMPVKMWQLLQRLGTRHARVLGVSLESIEDSRYTWVLSRFRMVINGYPHLNDPVRLMTWPTGFDRLHAGRAFRITADGGPLLAEAESDWLVIDVKSRRPMRVEPFVTSIDVPVAAVHEHVPRLESPGEPEYGEAFGVSQSDIDANEHVNNVRYVSWALNAVPEDIRGLRRLAEITVNYNAESVLGDTIAVGSGPCNSGAKDEYYHIVRRIGDDRELVRAHTRWQ